MSLETWRARWTREEQTIGPVRPNSGPAWVEQSRKCSRPTESLLLDCRVILTETMGRRSGGQGGRGLMTVQFAKVRVLSYPYERSVCPSGEPMPLHSVLVLYIGFKPRLSRGTPRDALAGHSHLSGKLWKDTVRP